MTSSMLTGERRWASSGRRGGMTVIGKVVVPKPINLPSQRLENHGLDPNVEIVPKGTLSWGSKSSSNASNPWGSSTLSPNTDGGGGSPSRLSGRPSSGGSGTRPSTAGSDRAYEPTNNAWGQSSRPSSASGLVTSNQTTLTSLRPRSAETRPGSSHLSRFAESVSENSGAWGAAGTAEKLGVTSTKGDGFSLATGDFPTLGSEKDNSEKNIDSQDHESHDRPGSSSGRVAPAKEKNATFVDGSCESSVDANVKNSTANSWRRENPAYGEEAVRPNVEKWHGDPNPYPNANIRPQHYEAWRGPPVNNPPPPGGVWYRGPPGAPPFGNPVPPCGFPMEPFPYFHPQMPGASLPNPQSVSPPGSGPRGHHPKNGDMYRPHMPDAYIRPGMPIRPGFYPGPVAYDGYYGPPMGYCNSNERDIPFMGMAAGPAVYNRYSGPNGPDPGNSHSRSGGYGPSGKALPEHEDSGHPHDTRGPYKVLLKHHNGLEERDDQKWEGNLATNATSKEKSDQPRKLQENEWGADHKDEGMNPRRTAGGEESSYQTSDRRGGRSSVRNKVNSPESMGNRKVVDDISVKKSEHVVPSFPKSQQTNLAAPKDSSLIQKIEGLNAKARDARHDVSSVSNRDGHGNKIQVVKVNHSANEVGSGSVCHEKSHSSRVSTPPSREGVLSTVDRHLESVNADGVAISRRSHGMQGKADHRGKGRSNTQEGDGWRKRSPVLASPNMISAAQSGTSSVVSVQGHHTSTEAFENSEAYHQMKDEKEAGVLMFDPNDPQRAKMKELAQQRLKQRQKEEEERISRQKANARAKLEELNRRTQTVEGSGYKSGPNQNGKEEPQVFAESMTATGKLEGLSLTSHLNFPAQISEISVGSIEILTLSSSEPALEMPGCAPKQPVVVQNLSALPQHDAHNADARKNASQAHDGGVPKQKRMDSKQKQNISLEKTVTEKLSSISVLEAIKERHDVPVKTIVSAEVATDGIGSNFEPPVNPNINVESTVHQKRKNRGAKNKHKVETVSSVASMPSSALKETNPLNISDESGKPKASESELPTSSLQSVMSSEDANQSSYQQSSLPHEDSHVRVNNLSKSQHSRRMQRNPLNNRTAEKFHSGDAVVWAPVRSHNRAEVADEASNKTVVEAVTSLKSDSVQNNNPKNKRAEIEIYVPKPVAKELAQLGSIQQPVGSSISQDASNEAVGSVDSGSQGTVCRQPANSATGKVGFAMESRNVDGRPNKQQGKAHGSWRQRGASESASTQGSQDGLSHTSNSNRNVQKSVEHQQPKKSGMGLIGKEQLKFSSEENAPDILSIPDNSDSVHGVKDQGVTGRVKRQPYRGHKNTGNSYDIDHKKLNSGDTDKICAQSKAPPLMSQTDLTSKENRVAGERSITHWQPKSQSIPGTTNQQGSQPDGGQSFNVEVSTGKKKESSTQRGMPLLSQHTDTGKSVAQPHHDHYASIKSHVDEALNVGHQEAKREKKTASLRGRPHSPNQGSVGSVEPASGSVDIRHEHRSHSGFRKNGNQSSRFGRGQDSHGDWSSAGQDNRQHNQPSNRDRQRQNAHYEYQPVGPYNNNSKSSNEGPNDRSHNMGGRFRDRGQGHPRRGGGNFYGRQTDSVGVDAGYD